ncbi:MAG: ABC transporter substrate-binding protein [Candidatus Acidiferrales bacterium]
MKLRLCLLLAAISIGLVTASTVDSARRPRYGGTLRVEIGATISSLDPAVAAANPIESAAKAEIDSLIFNNNTLSLDRLQTSGTTNSAGAFQVSSWQPGKSLTLAANESFPGGRPFVDAIQIQMGRPARDRLLDLEIGKVDFAEISPEQARQAAERGVRVTFSRPDELLALVFLPRRAAVDDARVREALALSIDRGSIVDFILQKAGAPAWGLLPQWSSGSEFLFSSSTGPIHVKEIWSQMARAPRLALGYDSGDTLEQSIAERIVVNAREAGISLATQAVSSGPFSRIDVLLVRLRMNSPDPRIALSDFVNALGPIAPIDARPLPEPSTPEDIYHREQAILSGYRIIPLVWLPQVYGVSARVRDWMPPGAGVAWPLADVWLDGEPR